LVDYGFRLPSALDNRPLRFDEFMHLVPRMMFVSATPGEDELRLSGGVIVEQIIRPTGLVDPNVEIRPVAGQVDDLLHEIRQREKKNERVLVTTLTKRMAEDLTDYLQQHAAVDHKIGGRYPLRHSSGRRPRRATGDGRRAAARGRARTRGPDHRARATDASGGRGARFRARGGAARSAPRTQGRCASPRTSSSGSVRRLARG